MKIALVCIAKNEDRYIQEWVDYNKKLGFDDIFIYQNDWRCQLEDPNIIKIEMDGVNQQRAAYNHFIKNNYNNYDWAAFFDVDEFLVLKKHKNIKDFIFDYSNYSAIGINWVLFGNNGFSKIGDDTSVLKRFTKRQISVNHHIKSIVKLSNNITMCVHNPPYISTCDTNNKTFIGPFNNLGDDNIAQLNHYFCKTEEEFIEKCNRGRADIPNQENKRTMNEFTIHNFNDLEDLTALNFLYDNNNIFNT
jgi:hypothetical protein